MVSISTVVALGLTLLGATPLGSWWLQVEGRNGFIADRSTALVSVSYVEEGGELLDPEYTPRTEVRGLVTIGKDGSKTVQAPYGALLKARDLKVHFRSGRAVAGELVQPDAPMAATLVEVKLPPGSLEEARGLRWATHEEPITNRTAWIIESTPGLEVGGPSKQVLVDTFVGPPVEPPLAHLHYVEVRRAVGLPLLDEQGDILCVVFRVSDLHKDRSLCVPGHEGGAPSSALRPLVIEP